MKKIIVIFLFLLPLGLAAQDVKFDNIGNNFTKKEFLKINGGLSANSIYSWGNNSSRDPFNYFLNGNLQLTIANLIKLPFTFSFTNSGSNMAYPTMPNRLSLHPSYKWITAHIGDISMNFSPLTLGGHQFTGVGVDLAPSTSFKTSFMYGRLQRKVEYDSIQSSIPAAYERMGQGIKVRYDGKVFFAGSSYFHAKDRYSSLEWKPDSLNIFPQENTAVQVEFGVKPLKNLQLTTEYAISFLTSDIRIDQKNSNRLINSLLNGNVTTNSFDAYKVNLNYQFSKSSVGIGYDRVSPDYKTLGTYYTNNDYENVTFNLATSLWKDKITFSGNLGIESDDLKNQKERKTRRTVSSVNVTFVPFQRVSLTSSYSNFQSHANIKSQFDYLNQTHPTQNLDSLNFIQLSQSITSTLAYQLQQSQKCSQNVNLTVNYQDASDQQGDTKNQTTKMINSSFAYSFMLIPQSFLVNATFNYTQSTLSGIKTATYGPTLSTSAKLFSKKLSISISSAYNYNDNVSNSLKVFNLRSSLGYVFAKKHNFTISYILQNRYSHTSGAFQTANVNAGYTFSF